MPDSKYGYYRFSGLRYHTARRTRSDRNLGENPGAEEIRRGLGREDEGHSARGSQESFLRIHISYPADKGAVESFSNIVKGRRELQSAFLSMQILTSANLLG